MKIIYNQTTTADSSSGMLESIGVKRCYLKYIQIAEGKNDYIKKSHHHTGFEVHVMITGEQRYELGDETITLSSGELLIIPPDICHRIVSTTEGAEKFSLCYDKEDHGAISYIYAKAPEAMLVALRLAKAEYLAPISYSKTAIFSAVLLTLSILLRFHGGEPDTTPPDDNENVIFALAKRYIEDNIFENITSEDVANHCHLSTKQLTRIFKDETELPLGAYIRRKRSEKICALLEEGKLTLREISERMSFKNEYYFNAFFKKNVGITPGAYAKMVVK